MIDVPVAVKDALREGTYKKNYRFVVLNDDGTEDFTIDNDTLVSESVSIDERMCSGDTLKFGLCEGSSLDFQYFMLDKGQYEANKTYMRNNLVHSNGVTWRSRTDNNTGNPLVEGDYWTEWVKPNITGRRVQVFVDVEYVLPPNTWGDVVRIDAPISDPVPYILTEDGEYRIRKNGWCVVTWTHGGETYSSEMHYNTYKTLGDLVRGDTVSVRGVGASTTAMLQRLETMGFYSIPMGFFDVKKCSRQASTGIIKATCYNKLQSDYLDAKANELIQVIPSDNLDGTVSLYTILKNTLSAFGINEKPKQYIPVTLGEASPGYGYSYPSISLKLNGNTHTYYPSVLTDGSRAARPSFFIDSMMVTFSDLSQYIDLLQQSLNSMKTAIYQMVQDPDTFYNSIKGIIEYFDIDIQYRYDPIEQRIPFFRYTLPELIDANSPDYRRSINDLQDIWDAQDFDIYLPKQLDAVRDISSSQSERITIWENPLTLSYSLFDGKIIAINGDEFSSAELVSVDTATLPDATLRELQTAVYETECQFGQLDRVTDLFAGVELNHSRLYPADTLYPATDLYPDGAAVSGFKSMYSKLWADEGNIHKWRYLIITYKGLDEEQNEVDYTLQRTVNADGTDDYNMSDNWLFRNLVWTAEDVGDYADAMVAKMQDVTWFPFEMWCAGLPYLETGDEIEIPLNGESYTSYVLQRQLKGIQNLQDTYINGTLDIF